MPWAYCHRVFTVLRHWLCDVLGYADWFLEYSILIPLLTTESINFRQPGSRSHHIQYGSLFFSIPGTYTTAPTLSAWSSNNAAPQTRRATAIAIGFIMTNSGGILATWLLGSLSPAPEYTSATITLLVFSLFMAIFGAINLGYLWSQNKKKAENRRRTTVEQEKEEKSGLGDRSAWFVYNLWGNL